MNAGADGGPILRVRDVVYVVETPEGASLRILNGITFDVARGEFIALTGQSGCGKTTLLRLLLGIGTATSGVMESAGKPIDGCDHHRTMVFQNAELLDWRTAFQNIMLPMAIRGLDVQTYLPIARKLLAQVGLKEFENKYPDELSGGMKQRVADRKSVV